MSRSRFAPLLVVAAIVLGAAPAGASDTADHEPAAHAQDDGHAEHGDHHVPTLDDVNWYYGMLMERDGVEPSLLFRPKGMPVPFLGYVFNAFVLYYLLYRFARRPVREGLARRKAGIERGMKEAAELKANAEAELASYQRKLETIEEEIERVRREMRRAGELERARILSEARSRRERMERDAKLLVEQELAAARELLIRDTVRSAIRSAGDTLSATVTPADHARLAEEYLSGLPRLSTAARSSP